MVAQDCVRTVLELFVGLSKDLVEDDTVLVCEIYKFLGFFGKVGVDLGS